MTGSSMPPSRHIPGARVVVVPGGAVEQIAAGLDRALGAHRFRVVPTHGVEGLVRFYRRGSAAGDVLIGGSGLGAFTRTLGPLLSVRGGVVLHAESMADGRIRLTAALVFGDDSIPDVTKALDAIIREAAARGTPIDDQGWIRAVDVPSSSPANPKTAAALGLR
ncbi:MAG: hypothetical protein JST33_06945 [Actinobacteria bacterium]|nr:hypothetical protein [Actinomycetota bacterium]